MRADQYQRQLGSPARNVSHEVLSDMIFQFNLDAHAPARGAFFAKLPRTLVRNGCDWRHSVFASPGRVHSIVLDPIEWQAVIDVNDCGRPTGNQTTMVIGARWH